MTPNENPNNAQPRQPQARPAAQTQANYPPNPQTQPGYPQQGYNPQAQPGYQQQGYNPQAQPGCQQQGYNPQAQTPGYPPQTPTPPNAPYGPSPEPKLAERLNVQALVDFIKRPPVLVALLVVAAFCLGRCDGGGKKDEVAQTPSAATEVAVNSDAAVGGKIAFQSREEFLRRFCQICRRALTRIRLNVGGSVNTGEPNAAVLDYFLDIDSTPSPSAWPEIQKYGLPEWKIALEEFQTFDLSQFSDVEQAQFDLFVDSLRRVAESDRLAIHTLAIQANEAREMFLDSMMDCASKSEQEKLEFILQHPY